MIEEAPFGTCWEQAWYQATLFINVTWHLFGADTTVHFPSIPAPANAQNLLYHALIGVQTKPSYVMLVLNLPVRIVVGIYCAWFVT